MTRHSHWFIRNLPTNVLHPSTIGRAGSLLLAALLGLPALKAVGAETRPLTGKPWIDMNYGPFKTHSLEVYPGNIANKGIAIRVDSGEGGVTAGKEFLLFESDTLRYAAGWTGSEFCNWRNIMHSGEHGAHMAIVGHTVFANPDAPGWADAKGSFAETRFLGRDGRYYGPMAKTIARWKGLYQHGQQVVLSYEVGGADILELPGAEGSHTTRAFTRTLNIGPRPGELVMQVAHQKNIQPQLRALAGAAEAQFAIFPTAQKQSHPASGKRNPWIHLDGRTRLTVDNSQAIDFTTADFTIFARIRTQSDGTILSKTLPEAKWTTYGKTFFVRGGRLGYDIGWVGAVNGRTQVTDGKWHKVALAHRAQDGLIEIYLDGKLDARGQLTVPKPENGGTRQEAYERMKQFVLQLGYTAPNFPTKPKSYFKGDLADVRIYQTHLSSREIAGLGRRRSEYQDPRILGRWDFRQVDTGRQTTPDGAGKRLAHIIVAQPDASDYANTITVAGVAGDTRGVQWLTTEDGHLRLKIPAGQQPIRLKVLLSQVTAVEDTAAFETLVRQTPMPIDLKPLTHGGPANWTETVTTKCEPLGRTDGAFVVESITVPFKNPYHSWMRTGGFDFFPDGRRAVISTVMGDVWIVDGLGSELQEVTWKRIATGLYEPMGVRIVDGVIYVNGRDQITRLHDLNGDQETDFYECFTHDNMASEHYHEFAQCLETDAAGNFYYVKAAGHNHLARFPQHGTILKVSKDGKKTEIYATGFRAPNGLWVSPDGKFCLTTDQEGHWTPENTIEWVKPGEFHGYMMAWAGKGRDENDFVPPVTWMHKKYDNSPSEAFFIESKKWGPLYGKMAHISYGKGKVFLDMYETASNGLKQGGITPLDIKEMPAGLQRCRFNPRDGQMYLLGLFVWCSDQTQPGGFYRVTYTDKPLHMPLDLHIASDGVVIEFTDALNPASATDTGNYSVEMWKYWRRRNYGSADYKVLSEGEGHDALEVQSVTLSADHKTVFLEIPGIRPVMQMHIDLNLKAADGTRMRTYVHHTIHALGTKPGREMIQ